MSFAEAYRQKKDEFEALRTQVLPKLEAKIQSVPPSAPEYRDLQQQIKDIKGHKQIVEYIFSILPLIKSTTTPPQLETTFNTKGNLSSVVDLEGTTNKGSVFAEYLRTVENNDTHEPHAQKYSDLLECCTVCGCSELVIIDRDAQRVCSECGNVEFYQREDAPQFTFKEECESMTVSVQFAYKRSNHFCDWLNAFEAGMCTNSVPPDVLDTLRYELKKLRVTDVNTIKPTLIRQLMKKTNLTKYYEYTNAIRAEICGTAPISFNPELKCKLRVMFSQLQAPFQQFKPDNRKNFLSYSYVIYKCLQLLGQDSFLQYFTLLKSRDKLKLQDHIWKKICDHLKWEYISSV